MVKNLVLAISIVVIMLLGCGSKSKSPDVNEPTSTTNMDLLTFLKDPHKYAGRPINIEGYAVSIIPTAFVIISDVQDPLSGNENTLNESIHKDITDNNFTYFDNVVEGEYYQFPILVKILEDGNYVCIANGHPKK